jgi:uncharacterized protein (DUF362 family)/Pyruvate/2-oxoacid:ferredoxin oxidoreductase delta subunit
MLNGNEITIGDSSGLVEEHGTANALAVSGIKAVAEKYGRLAVFEREGSVAVRNENGAILKEVIIAKPVAEADFIVSIPKLKTHVLTKFTGAVKNTFGCVPGGLKQKYHNLGKTPERFCQLLVDVLQAVKPNLTIMDGICGIEGNGPGAGGKPKKAGVIIASENPAALDIVASEMIGFKPMDIVTNKEALTRGLVSEKDIEVIGERAIVNFEKPDMPTKGPVRFLSSLYFRLQLSKPALITDKCIKCGICAKVCPVKAIVLNPYPVFDYSTCIRCYCCHENCPHSAINLKKSKLAKAASRIKKAITGG